MNASKAAMKELIGEHEAIMAYMRSMTDSAGKLVAPSADARQRLCNYRYRLYDFRDAIWYHLEIDERVFKSVLGEANEDPVAEHREIQRLVDQMIAIADNTAIEKQGQAEIEQFCRKLEAAFDRICKLIALHIATENAILERLQLALSQGGSSG